MAPDTYCLLPAILLFIPAVWLPLAAAPVITQNVEFKGVVKLIESHYRVKHKGVPLLARMGIKATQMVVQRAVRYSEYGSVKFAVFEDQDFSAAGSQIDFAARMRGALEPEWQPLVQVRLQQDADQTYIYMKEAGKFFKVLVITIGQRDATAVQVELAPLKLWKLMKDPDAAGKTLTDEAAGDAAPD